MRNEHLPTEHNMRDLECIRLMDSDVLHNFLIELYQVARDPSTAVRGFCEMFLTSTKDGSGGEHPYAEHAWTYNECTACDSDTPTVPEDVPFGTADEGMCACCSSVVEVKNLRLIDMPPEQRHEKDYAENQIRLRESWYNDEVE